MRKTISASSIHISILVPVMWLHAASSSAPLPDTAMQRTLSTRVVRSSTHCIPAPRIRDSNGPLSLQAGKHFQLACLVSMVHSRHGSRPGHHDRRLRHIGGRRLHQTKAFLLTSTWRIACSMALCSASLGHQVHTGRRRIPQRPMLVLCMLHTGTLARTRGCQLAMCLLHSCVPVADSKSCNGWQVCRRIPAQCSRMH